MRYKEGDCPLSLGGDLGFALIKLFRCAAPDERAARNARKHKIEKFIAVCELEKECSMLALRKT